MDIGWNQVPVARAITAHSSEQSSSTVIPSDPREFVHRGNYQSWASSVNVLIHRHYRKRGVWSFSVKFAFESRTSSEDPSSRGISPIILRSHAFSAPRTKMQLDRGSLDALSCLLGLQHCFGFVKIVGSQTLSDP